MAKAKKKTRFAFLKKNLLLLSLSLLLIISAITAYQVLLTDKFYPFTYVGNINISFLEKGRAVKLVQTKFQKRAVQQISFNYPQGFFIVDLATSSAALNYTELDAAFSDSHSGTALGLLQKKLQALFSPAVISPKIDLSLDKQLDNIAAAVKKEAQNARLFFDEAPTQDSTASARIQIKEAENGLELDKEQTKKQIGDFLLTGKYSSHLALKIIPPKISTSYVARVKEILEASLNQPITLVFDQNSWSLDTKQLLALLDLEIGQGSFLDKDKTYIYLKNIASEIDQNVQEGLFEFNPDTKRVNAFKASREGRKLNINQTFILISQALISENSTWGKIELPVEVIKPKVDTADINNLGIKELLGRGVSNFAGSIPNRIYNVGLTANKINGILIPPGEVFSFNQAIGDISAATGFRQAYVIKEGRTVLDDGGGVCQDSTTLFRAVLNAGLPVIKRTAHAYRVGYYEQGFPPGLDATVFYPSVDFQFKNDTPAHILIQAYTSGLTLYFDLYGTADGRVVNLTKPVITSQTPPPADLRQDDPTLPKGTVKQVDWSAWGANVSFKRTVTRAGKVLTDETWRSNYKPWQAVYLVGIKEN